MSLKRLKDKFFVDSLLRLIIVFMVLLFKMDERLSINGGIPLIYDYDLVGYLS